MNGAFIPENSKQTSLLAKLTIIIIDSYWPLFNDNIILQNQQVREAGGGEGGFVDYLFISTCRVLTSCEFYLE